MFDTYKEIFDKRATSYHKAMQDFPLARYQEFSWAIKYLDIQSGHVVCDMPSGGGYLRNYVTEKNCYFKFLETSENFIELSSIDEKCSTLLCQFDDLCLENKSVDRLISLAALHHVHNKVSAFKEFRRVLKPDGIMLIIDVEENTGTANFLNVFVNKYNSMGHKGEFLNATSISQLESVGMKIIAINRPELHWVFNTESDMVSFCRNLFGLDLATNKNILEGIQKHLRVVADTGNIKLSWQLTYIVAEVEKIRKSNV